MYADPAKLEFLTPPDIAKMLGTDHGKILRWIRSGELLAVDLSTHRRQKPRYKVSRVELDAFLRRRSTVQRRPVAPRRQRDDDGDNLY